MSGEALAAVMREYGDAIRGDWVTIDGRSVRYVMDDFAAAVEGRDQADWPIRRWRDSLGICPAGEGHWAEYCDSDCEGER